MKFASSIAALAAVAAASPVANSEIEARQFSCVNGVHVVALGGQYTTTGNLSYLQTLADSITAAIPGSDVYQIGYPEGATGATDMATGMPGLTDHITQYAAACPDTKMVTIGYSIGAAVVMNVLCGGSQDPTQPPPLSRDYRSNIVANIVYGDPTFLPTQRSRAGTCQDGQGVQPRLKPGLCYPYGRKTKSYCDYNDPQCCSGSDPNVHFTYPANYDGAATQWVKAKFAYYKHHRN